MKQYLFSVRFGFVPSRSNINLSIFSNCISKIVSYKEASGFVGHVKTCDFSDDRKDKIPSIQQFQNQNQPLTIYTYLHLVTIRCKSLNAVPVLKSCWKPCAML